MDAAVKFPTTPEAVTAGKLTLSRRMNVEDAFRAVMMHCLAQVQGNEEGVAKFHHVESLHQMRVGLRRMRSALRIFEDAVRLPEGLQSDLDWLVGELGPARDWDVLAGSTLDVVEQALPASASAPVAEVRQAAQNRAQQAHTAAAQAVVSPRYEIFVLALQSWVSERGWRLTLVPGDKARLAMRIKTFARCILDNDQQRLRKRGRKLGGADVEARHRVRIAAKKTRYAAEFFGSLYSQRRVRTYVKALSGLQDELGALNDASVAEGLLQELMAADGALTDGASFVRGYLAARGQGNAALLKRSWKRFKSTRAP